MLLSMDIRELGRRALAYAEEIVARVGADRLTAPAPTMQRYAIRDASETGPC